MLLLKYFTDVNKYLQLLCKETMEIFRKTKLRIFTLKKSTKTKTCTSTGRLVKTMQFCYDRYWWEKNTSVRNNIFKKIKKKKNLDRHFCWQGVPLCKSMAYRYTVFIFLPRQNCSYLSLFYAQYAASAKNISSTGCHQNMTYLL